MNILFISNDPSIFIEGSAARTRMRAYAKEVAVLGGMMHVLSRSAKKIELQDGALMLHGVSGNKLLALMSMPGIARRLIRTQNIAVVSAQDPFEYGRVAAKAVQGTAAKLHIQIHTDFLSPWFTRSGMARGPRVPMPLLNKARIKIADRVLPKAAGIRVVSERIKRSLVTRYGAGMESVSVIPIAVDPVLPAPVPLPEPHRPFMLLTASRLEPEKRIEDILQAISMLKEAYPALGLMIAGEGRERAHLTHLVQKLGLSDRVWFLGTRTDVRGLMQSAQAYIQASAYEGYGITLIEAALTRLPIITTDVGIVGEVLGSEDVLVTPPGDPTQLMHHIRRCIEDPDSRLARAMHAQAAASAHLANAKNTPAHVIADIASLAV